MPEFGVQIDGVEYVERPGAYAVIVEETNGRVFLCAIEGPGGYYLPGGGIEGNESPEDALHREVLEELGCDLSLIRLIGRANDYLYASTEQVYFNKIGTFYLANVNGNVGRTEAHNIRWLDARDDLNQLAQESHRWAIETALAPSE